MKRSVLVLTSGALLVSACAGNGPTGPTIKDLDGQTVAIKRDAPVPGGRERAISGYRAFLDTTEGDPLRAEAMRRLGDLELESSDERSLRQSEAAPPGEDYRRIARVYEDLLRVYPDPPQNDRVLYQLAKAYEQAGDLPASLGALDRLMARYPQTPYRDEVQFRRGELLFLTGQYEPAGKAYAAVVADGERSPFYENALFMRGWSLFKQERYELALDAFFTLLDRRLAGRALGDLGNSIPSLTRADQELIDDALRVVSLSFSYLDGSATVERYLARTGGRDYAFRLYEHLGALYQKNDRITDAADAYQAFVRQSPNHLQAPRFQLRIIDTYRQHGFPAQALDAKREFVTRYGVESEYAHSHPAAYAQVLPQLKANIEDLARHHHALAQKQDEKRAEHYAAAARWYRAFLHAFADDAQAAQMNFLLAESLFESGQQAASVDEYEKTAYSYPLHAKSAEAGYGALLAYAAVQPQLMGRELQAWRQRAVASSLRFADRFPEDKRAPAVLTTAAEQLYAMHDGALAHPVAQRVLALKPPAATAQRRTAWTIVGHTSFEQGAFDRAETAYGEVLALSDARDGKREALGERLAASIYKQGEQSRSQGDLTGAVAHFLRLGQVVPAAAVRATAEYDAAAVLITLKDWTQSARVLEAFRKRYPAHPLAEEVTQKLAVSYLEGGQSLKAAGEFERMARGNKDPALGRAALWQAAELYQKAENERAFDLYAHYVARYPDPFEQAIEARSRLAALHEKQRDWRGQQRWLRELLEAEQAGAAARTDRTRYLGAQAAMTLAEPACDDYRKVKLVEPLKKHLKQKKDKMQAALNAYSVAAEYGVAEVATASTFRIAEIYNDFGKALLDSQRPKGLNAEELEQYNVLLEEQAYPFEEKAIEIHEINAMRTAKGIYDRWVQDSFAALGKLRPVRYAKAERSEATIDALR